MTTTLSRIVPLLTLSALLALPLSASAKDGKRSQRRSGDDTHERRDSDRSGSRDGRSDSSHGRSDSSHGRSDSSSRTRNDSRSGRGATTRSSYRSPSRSHRDSSRDRHGHRYGYGNHRTRVVVRQPTVIVSAPVYPRRYIEPMYLSRVAFDDVMYDLSRARFEDDRMAIIQHVGRVYTVNTFQVRAMVGELRFSSNRLNALTHLHSRTRDLENWYQVYDLLSFSSERRALRSSCGY